MLRAKPSAVFNSSTEPYASTRRSAFEMRTPPANPVCPPSPCVVAILIFRLLVLHRFHQKAWRTMEQYDLVCSHASSSEHPCSAHSTVRSTPACVTTAMQQSAASASKDRYFTSSSTRRSKLWKLS